MQRPLLVVFLEDGARQHPAVRFRVLGRLGWRWRMVFREHGLDFKAALRRRPVGEVTTRGIAGRRMLGMVTLVTG